jgi:mono/diheme cytochrome c family protein
MPILRNALITLLLLAVVLAAAGSAVIYSGWVDVAADSETSRPVAWLLETTRERAVSRRAGQLQIQSPDHLDQERLYEAIVGFEQMCATCHAPPGSHPSAIARGLHPPPPALSIAARTRSAQELFWVTRHGIRMTGMPTWHHSHSDDELLTLIYLIERFPQFTEGQYQSLLTAALEAGVEHVHAHDNEHDHDNDHDNGHTH